MYDISLFLKVKYLYPKANATLEYIFNYIKTTLDPSVELYRKTFLVEDKKNTPCYTASGVFDKRCISGLLRYNGIVSIDIDFKDQPKKDEFENLINRLRKWEYTYCLHKSISGKGYALYIITDNKNPDLHKRYFNKIVSTIQKTGIVADIACSDISRLRYISYDPDLYLNEKASIWNEMEEYSRSNSDVSYCKANDPNSEIRDCVRYLKAAVEMEVDLFDSYEYWKRGAFAMSSTFGNDGRDMFHRICSFSPKYDERECDKIYDKGLKTAMNGDETKKIYTLFDMLKQKNVI